MTSPLPSPALADVDHRHRVELSLGADAQMLFLARMTGAAVASRADFEYEQIEDLRLAIDELCVRLMSASNSGGRLGLLFQWDDAGTLDVTGTLIPEDSPAGNGRRPRPEMVAISNELSERILDALVDDHGDDMMGDVHRAWLRMRRQEHSG
jgi:serine/threonine-protein kinase RsbW